MITACVVANAVIKDAKRGHYIPILSAWNFLKQSPFQKYHLQVMSLRRLSSIQDIKKKRKKKKGKSRAGAREGSFQIFIMKKRETNGTYLVW